MSRTRPLPKWSASFVVSIRRIHEDLACYGCWYGASVGHRRRFRAERKHDEWWYGRRRLDGWIRRYGWIRRDMGADFACHRGCRPRGLGRHAKAQVNGGMTPIRSARLHTLFG